jgi:membrane-associated protease RseP (regulator of RpoE activity)
MSSPITPIRRACRRGVGAIAIALAMAFPFGADAAQQATCPAGEGTPVAAQLDLRLCDGIASTTVVTRVGPQHGARVAAADPNGPAGRGGLVPGDIIYQVDGRRVESGKAAAAALEAARGAPILLVNFWRDGKPYLVRIWTKRP